MSTVNVRSIDALEELQATAHLHRSPVVLQSVRDYLAGQRFDARLIQADPSIYSVPQPTEHTQDLLARL